VPPRSHGRGNKPAEEFSRCSFGKKFDKLSGTSKTTASRCTRVATPWHIYLLAGKKVQPEPREPSLGSVTRGGQMTRKLRVHAHVVKRAGQDGDEDRARVGTGCRRGVVVSALTGGYRSNYQPNQDDEPSDSHMTSQRRAAPAFPKSREVETYFQLPRWRRIHVRGGTYMPDIRSFARRSTISAARFPGRCIVSADGPGCRDRAAQNCGRSARPPAGPSGGGRWLRFPVGCVSA